MNWLSRQHLIRYRMIKGLIAVYQDSAFAQSNQNIFQFDKIIPTHLTLLIAGQFLITMTVIFTFANLLIYKSIYDGKNQGF
jgi:hypothetical protein